MAGEQREDSGAVPVEVYQEPSGAEPVLVPKAAGVAAPAPRRPPLSAPTTPLRPSSISQPKAPPPEAPASSSTPKQKARPTLKPREPEGPPSSLKPREPAGPPPRRARRVGGAGERRFTSWISSVSGHWPAITRVPLSGCHRLSSPIARPL